MSNLFIISILAFSLTACNAGDSTGRSSIHRTASVTETGNKPEVIPGEKTNHPGEALITFIELGSVNCIPCKKMQPVMKAVEEKYGDQIRVIFYDVWKADQKKYAGQYKIMSIPTQVFLDASGEEISRHIGFYPENEIHKFLQSQGLIPIEQQIRG